MDTVLPFSGIVVVPEHARAAIQALDGVDICTHWYFIGYVGMQEGTPFTHLTLIRKPVPADNIICWYAFVCESTSPFTSTPPLNSVGTAQPKRQHIHFFYWVFFRFFQTLFFF